MSDLVVRGGCVVTPQGMLAGDIAIEDERISAISPDLPRGREEIDASRLTVFPGLIDVHVHFNDPGRADWEGARTGSSALAAGGGTLFADMPLNSSPCTVNAAGFDDKLAALSSSSLTDFALWGGIVPGNLRHMAELAGRGVIGFKAFLCDSGLAEFPRADDLTLYEGMREAARLNLPVAVHAENEEITKGLTKRLIAEGRHDIPAFLESRPVAAEVEAIQRAGLLARQTGSRLHIVHISAGSGIAAALEARALGADISIETCPHYLFFTEEDLLRIGALAKCAPPLRIEAERRSLWDAVRRGEVDIIGSDHSPCPPEMKNRESFFEIWGGITGVQTTLPVLIAGGLGPESIAATTAASGAKRFNLRSKGSIEIGNHADLALVDRDREFEVTQDMLMYRHRGSPYAGRRLRGVVRKTIRRGEIIFCDGRITTQRGGRLIGPGKRPNE
jgi:allantoinase